MRMIGRRKLFGIAGVVGAMSFMRQARAGRHAPDNGIRHVSLWGSDAWDGLSWETAKRSVFAAVDSLPTEIVAGATIHTGKVVIGRGEFVETELPIEASTGLVFEGQGTRATVIRQGASNHLFAPTPDYMPNWGHELIFRDLRVRGDKISFPGDFDLIRLQRGGFNTALYNVYLRDAPRWGLHISAQATNVYLYNCSASNCEEAAIRFDIAPSTNVSNLGIYGFQVDNSGFAPIHIVSEQNGGVTVINITGVEAEDLLGDTHDAVIRYDRISGDNATNFSINGVSAFKSIAMGQRGTAVIHDVNPSRRGKWMLTNIHGSQYDQAFQREFDGANSGGPHLYREDFL